MTNYELCYKIVIRYLKCLVKNSNTCSFCFKKYSPFWVSYINRPCDNLPDVWGCPRNRISVTESWYVFKNNFHNFTTNVSQLSGLSRTLVLKQRTCWHLPFDWSVCLRGHRQSSDNWSINCCFYRIWETSISQLKIYVSLLGNNWTLCCSFVGLLNVVEQIFEVLINSRHITSQPKHLF